MEKALTFEEWDNASDFVPTAREVFDLARKGMIPESEAVRIPKPEQWPSWAVGVRMVYEEGLAWVYGSTGASTTEQRIKVVHGAYRPRPIPAWTPKVGEPVFALDRLTPNGVWVAKVVTKPVMGRAFIVCNDGDESNWDTERLKPFNASYIGRPWHEIPGGVE